jgi:hypothetical protein
LHARVMELKMSGRVARKEGSRTLVDVESLKACYAGLPVKQ